MVLLNRFNIRCKLEQHIHNIDLFVTSIPISRVQEDIGGHVTVYRYNIYIYIYIIIYIKYKWTAKFILKGTDHL